MIRFKDFYEEFREPPFKAELAGIFKNPTSSEWNKIPADVRAFATKDGDLFVSSVGGKRIGFHDYIIRSIDLTKFLPVSKTSKMHYFWRQNGFSVSLQRIHKTMGFALGESSGVYDMDAMTEKLNDIKIILKKTKRNNPNVIFILKNITDLQKSRGFRRV